VRVTWQRLVSLIVLSLLFPASHAGERAPGDDPGHSAAPPAGLRLRLMEMQGRAGIAAASAPAETPPEPRREPPPSRKRSFFRSRSGVIVTVLAGAVIVGYLTRSSIRDGS
jgi:hypothetical protein